jgi:hypothetical protein
MSEGLLTISGMILTGRIQSNFEIPVLGSLCRPKFHIDEPGKECGPLF